MQTHDRRRPHMDSKRSDSQLLVSDAEFRDDVIYFIVVDRFHDGNPHNMGARPDLNDPLRVDWNKYWGGDLEGILSKLPYLEQLGVTALWLTPLFEQVEAVHEGEAPLHGYWTRDFKRINERWVNDPSEVRLFARNDTVFDRLVAELHRRGMKLVLDIVCNHSSPSTDIGKGQLYDDGELVADFEHDDQQWYHHYNEITDWQDQWQVENGEIKSLATFNENNVHYRRYITGAIKLWLDKGVDALRIDTCKHMPRWFWQEFSADLKLHSPGVFMFGEWFDSHPSNPASVQFANQAGFSMLDFGFCQAIRRCLGGKDPAGFRAVQDLLDLDGNYRTASELMTFFENHDMPRLLTCNGDRRAQEMATALLLTSRGIPCLYYGSEQYLHNDTQGGVDPYNRPMMEHWEMETALFRLTRILSAERKRNQAVQWGGQWPKLVEAGLYVYLRRYRDQRLLVVLNQGADQTIRVPSIDLPDGVHRCVLTGTEIVVSDGTLQEVVVNQGAIWAFSVTSEIIRAPVIVYYQANAVPTRPGEYVAVTGSCPELGSWDLSRAVRLECINRNLWFGELPFQESSGTPIAYKMVILSETPGVPPRREDRPGRLRGVIQEGVTKWRDVWEE